MKKEKKKFKEKPLYLKIIIITSIVLVSAISALILVAGGYLSYVSIQFYRIEDNLDLTSGIIHSNNSIDSKDINSGTELSILSYNIGFGAYDQDYDFFMDVGEMMDGTVVTGTHAKARDYESALRNTDGSIDVLVNNEADFMVIQEIDVDSDRCYHINQYQKFTNQFISTHDSLYCSNFHSAFLAYPFNDMIGASESGLVTLSRYHIATALRKSYPVDLSFPNKFFDLDRCFSVSRFPLSNGKELVIGNSHMSAYDDGTIRDQQMTLLCSFLEQEKEAGNYVIIGGDYNHDICHSAGTFPTQEKLPGWVADFDEERLPEGYHVQADPTIPSCRAAEMPYQYGVNYLVVIDGFITSENITVNEVKNLDLQFMYSDHNPATMKFTLNI